MARFTIIRVGCRGLPEQGFGSLEDLCFRSPLAKLSRSSVSFNSEEELLVNTITLSAIFEGRKPRNYN
jgi:hypothetical protein